MFLSHYRFVCTTFLLVLTACAVTDQAVAQLSFDPAFPSLNFARPVDLQNSGDGTNRLFVVEQNTGFVRVFQNDLGSSSSPIYLDVSDRFNAGENEEGLLGLAFHPDFATNGYLFVYYSATNPRRSIVERFRVDSLNQQLVDRSTGEEILSVVQPDWNHNGGHLRFGPDGYLYIALGDGGGGGDPGGNGQNRKTLLGSILRIDVNVTSPEASYGIPPDNPFADDTTGFKKEIFAWGLRNPWKFSFDTDGNLWAGDVGQGSLEEIDIIEKGKNYGWNTMEGTACYSPSSGCDSAGLELPVHEYGRSLGRSVTGGFVYRGNRAPELVGSYIFADFATGRIWSLPFENNNVGVAQQLFATGLNVATFGEDESGELYFGTFDGSIYHFTGSSVDVEGEPRQAFADVAVYPNPSREAVTFLYSPDRGDTAVLKIFDILGRQVFRADLPSKLSDSGVAVGAETASQMESSISAGHANETARFTWTFTARDVPQSGVYFFRLESASGIGTGSFLVIR